MLQHIQYQPALLSLLLWLGSLPLHHAAPVCVLRLTVNAAQSPFTVSGDASRPVRSKIYGPAGVTGTGSIYLLLGPPSAPAAAAPPAGAAASSAGCPEVSPANVQQLLASSQLVSPMGMPGVVLEPRNSTAEVRTVSTNATIATAQVLDYELGLQSLAPLNTLAEGLGAPAPAAAAPPLVPLAAEYIALNGTIVINSSLVGAKRVSIATLAENITLQAGASLLPAAGAGGPQQLQLTLQGANLVLSISPKNTPGVQFTTADIAVNGTVVAAVTLSDPATLLLVDDTTTNWNNYPRLAAPVVLGAEGAAPPTRRYVGEAPADTGA